MVVLRGRGVGHVDGGGRVGEPLLDVADERVGVEVGVHVRRRVEAGMLGPELDVVRCHPVLDLDPRRHLLRDLEGGGDDRGDDLAPVRHQRRAEQSELRVIVSTRVRNVTLVQDREHPRRCGGTLGRDPHDLARGPRSR